MYCGISNTSRYRLQGKNIAQDFLRDLNKEKISYNSLNVEEYFFHMIHKYLSTRICVFFSVVFYVKNEFPCFIIVKLDTVLMFIPFLHLIG